QPSWRARQLAEEADAQAIIGRDVTRDAVLEGVAEAVQRGSAERQQNCEQCVHAFALPTAATRRTRSFFPCPCARRRGRERYAAVARSDCGDSAWTPPPGIRGAGSTDDEKACRCEREVRRGERSHAPAGSGQRVAHGQRRLHAEVAAA